MGSRALAHMLDIVNGPPWQLQCTPPRTRDSPVCERRQGSPGGPARRPLWWSPHSKNSHDYVRIVDTPDDRRARHMHINLWEKGDLLRVRIADKKDGHPAQPPSKLQGSSRIRSYEHILNTLTVHIVRLVCKFVHPRGTRWHGGILSRKGCPHALHFCMLLLSMGTHSRVHVSSILSFHLKLQQRKHQYQKSFDQYGQEYISNSPGCPNSRRVH